jgi:hypothetical protein
MTMLVAMPDQEKGDAAAGARSAQLDAASAAAHSKELRAAWQSAVSELKVRSS